MDSPIRIKLSWSGKTQGMIKLSYCRKTVLEIQPLVERIGNHNLITIFPKRWWGIGIHICLMWSIIVPSLPTRRASKCHVILSLLPGGGLRRLSPAHPQHSSSSSTNWANLCSGYSSPPSPSPWRRQFPSKWSKHTTRGHLQHYMKVPPSGLTDSTTPFPGNKSDSVLQTSLVPVVSGSTFDWRTRV